MSDMFNRWLLDTLELQITSYGRPEPGTLEGEDLANSVMMNTTAIVAELGEALAEYPGWKTWVTDRSKIDRDAFVGEWVDVLHFIANILTAVGVDDRELSTRYEAKMQKNRDRMESGTYDGVKDKCPECRRELVYLNPEDGTQPACPEHGRIKV